jgi:hypothetical protein
MRRQLKVWLDCCRLRPKMKICSGSARKPPKMTRQWTLSARNYAAPDDSVPQHDKLSHRAK